MTMTARSWFRLEQDDGGRRGSLWRRLVAWWLLAGGIAVGILTTYLTIQSMIHPGHGDDNHDNDSNSTDTNSTLLSPLDLDSDVL